VKLEQWLNARWYGRPGVLYAFWPLECLFRALAALRRRNTRPQRCSAPVIVVGNIAVGGSGKTPAVLAIAQHLQEQGWHPGIVSRGYGGKAAQYPLFVTNATLPSEAGDEPCLMARRSGLPVAVAPDRVAAANLLVDEHACNVIISDDGLQHYRLYRDVEILLVDAARGFGNGHCLPLGPLREPPRRSEEVDLVISNGRVESDVLAALSAYEMRLKGDTLINVHSGERRTAADWPENARRVNAIAGIGHPPRFFAALTALGLDCRGQAFPDHYEYRPEDLQQDSSLPLVMTEKDAVKCAQISPADSWMFPVDAVLPDTFFESLDQLLDRVA